MVIYASLDKPVRIGAAGDNKSITIRFDVTQQKTEWPDGAATLFVQQGLYTYAEDVQIVNVNQHYYAEWLISSLNSLLARDGQAMIYYSYDEDGWIPTVTIINGDQVLKSYIVADTTTPELMESASNNPSSPYYTKLNAIWAANPDISTYSTKLLLYTKVKQATINPVLWNIVVNQSQLYQFVVDQSLELSSEVPVHPDQGLITTLTEIMNRTAQYASQASSSAVSAAASATSATASETNAALSAQSASTDATTASAAATTATTQATEATAAASHYPYVGQNGNWFTWNVDQTQWQDTGIAAHGEDGDDAVIVDILYNLSTSGQIAPASGWIHTIPSVPSNQYLWVRQVWNDETTTDYSILQGVTAAGGVQQITAGSGLTGGTITTSGTIAVDDTVIATRAWVTQTIINAINSAY